ncbi:MAG TPA: glycerol-3-phosphate dehydrogenase/oxidase [Oligoflexia bacterium]|nr:glycerol-3-phosphate dehydrogenase/oxidase [Oligoflexia bacterium]HMR24255.1 glycerol-3-phosphate dehydrogenase/oxidase [Oligoflexia bacterium]
MQETDYDLLIIGGGIQGAGVAREAVLQGLKVLLCEKKDFLNATSSQSSKLIHGGLRYLESLELKLVHEALFERKTILKSAKHAVYPLKFFIPRYSSNSRPFFIYRLGLWMYKMLAGRKIIGSFGVEEGQSIQKKYSFLKENFNKAAFYYDARTDDFRLGLDWLLDAQKKGLNCLNYTEVKNVKKKDDCFYLQIESNGVSSTVTAKTVVNAAGPWVNDIDQKIKHISRYNVKFGKGVHVLFETDICLKEAFLLEVPNEKRIFFILPWKKNRILVGTTDTEYQQSLEDIHANENDVNYIKQALQHYVKSDYLSQLKPVALMAGVRPLVMRNSKSSQELSRGYEIEPTLEGMWNIVGGKYTVFREVGEKVVAEILQYLNKDTQCDSESLPLTNSPKEDLENFIQTNKAELINKLRINKEHAEDFLKRYGKSWQQLQVYFNTKDQIDIKPWIKSFSYYPQELIYSIEHEHCKTLEDYMMRRTSLFYTQSSGVEIIDEVLKVLHEKNQLSPKVIEKQKRDYLKKVATMKNLLQKVFEPV